MVEDRAEIATGLKAGWSLRIWDGGVGGIAGGPGARHWATGWRAERLVQRRRSRPQSRTVAADPGVLRVTTL